MACSDCNKKNPVTSHNHSVGGSHNWSGAGNHHHHPAPSININWNMHNMHNGVRANTYYNIPYTNVIKGNCNDGCYPEKKSKCPPIAPPKPACMQACTQFPKVKCPPKPVCQPSECQKSCIEGEIGISAAIGGLSSRYAVGAGFERKTQKAGLNTPSGENFIPFDWLHPAIFDDTYPFTPRIETMCDGTIIERPDAHTTLVKDPTGDIIREYHSPIKNFLAGLCKPLKLNLTKTNPFYDETVSIDVAKPIKIEAGNGINIQALENGFKISLDSLNAQINNAGLKIVQKTGSPITVTGGTQGIPYTLDIDCGTLRAQCGLVRTINGITPDNTGNINITTTGGGNLYGINAITFPQAGTGFSVSNPSTGTAEILINKQGLKDYLGIGNLITGVAFPANSGITTAISSAGVVDVSINYTQFANNGFIRSSNGNGALNQVFVSNGDGTGKWVDLCSQIQLLGCTAQTPGPVTVDPADLPVAPILAISQAGTGNTTAYTNGLPKLNWVLSTTPGATYNIIDTTTNTFVATGITGNTYTFTTQPTTGSHSYALITVSNSGVYSGQTVLGTVSVQP